MNKAEFARRYALERLADGGVLLDRENGDYFLLNPRAATMLHEWPSDPEMSVEAPDLLGMLQHAEPSAPQDFSFDTDGDGFTMTWQGEDLLHVNTSGSELLLLPRPVAASPAPQLCLAWAATHLLTLQGVAVLHAAAIVRKGRAVLLLGPSGAGKTTAAHALATDGAPETVVMSEDMVALDPRQPSRPSLLMHAEPIVREWVANNASQWSASERVRLPVGDLRKTVLHDAAATEIDELWFLATRHNAGSNFQRAPMAQSVALVTLLRDGFGALSRADVWEQAWSACTQLVREVASWEVHAPSGLEALDEASRAYNRNSTS